MYRTSSGNKEREKENQRNYKADAIHEDIFDFQLCFALPLEQLEQILDIRDIRVFCLWK
jgi:hypothetical protein